MKPLRVVSLFAGIGGIDLGLERAGMRTVAQVEIDPFCRAVLAKNFPHARRFEDVKRFGRRSIRGAVDVVCGGFPCQDISVAGRGVGLGGKRSGLWWEMLRVIKQLKPRWIVIENVPALRSRGADDVLSALEAAGYPAWPVVVGAHHVGAPHARQRVWIVAHCQSLRWASEGEWRQPRTDGRPAVRGEGVADADGSGRRTRIGNVREGKPDVKRCRGPVANAERRLGDGPRRARGAEELRCKGKNGGRSKATHRPERRGDEMADASRERREERHAPARSSRPGFDSRPAAEGGWPAGPTESQHGWEEPRLVNFAAVDDADGLREQQPHRGKSNVEGRTGNAGGKRVANTVSVYGGRRGKASERKAGRGTAAQRPGRKGSNGTTERHAKRSMGSPVDGLSRRLVRLARRHNRNTLRAAGNSVVPLIPELIGRFIVQQHEGRAA